MKTNSQIETKVSTPGEPLAHSIAMWTKHIRIFIKEVWGLIPQPPKPKYKHKIDELELASFETWERLKKEASPEWYGDWNDETKEWIWHDFKKGKHITWQQNLVLMGIEKAIQKDAKTHISISSGHGVGKLHDYNTVLTTPKGEQKWGDLHVGDYLFGANGKPTRILETHHYKNIPMMRVTFDDGSYCDVSTGHLWNVRGRQERRKGLSSWRTMETIEILDKGVKRSNGVAFARQWEIPIQGMVEFEAQKTDLHPYLIGVWIGDGSVRKPEYTKIYSEIDEKIKSLGYDVSNHKDNKCHRILDVAHHFKIGVFNCRSYEKYIPDEYKFNSIENRMALFEGLCDTDGEVIGSGSIEYSTTSKQLAEDMVWLARSLGCKARIRPTIKKGKYRNKSGKIIECRDCYRVGINAPFNPFTVLHKKEKYKPSEQRYLTRWIESIEPIQNADGMCVSVEAEDGLYLANDFIVTHNSATIAWVALWFLYCFKSSQVPVTAPTAPQMHDVLWKEMSIWIGRMKPELQVAYIWTGDHVRMTAAPQEWFARAKTSSKENTEALAGIHADHVCTLIDEASGVPEQVFNTGEGALTSGDILVIMISNPTRLAGYFYDSHHKNKDDWQLFEFSCEDSPIVDKAYIERQEKRHGRDSDEFRIRVLGKFPQEEAMDDSGYVQLVPEQRIVIEQKDPRLNTLFIGKRILGIDPSGEGKDTATFAIRDRFKGEIVKTLKTTNPRQIAQMAITLIDKYQIDPEDVVVDSFGVGADVSKEIALSSNGKYDVYSILVGNKPSYEEEYNHKFFIRHEDEMDENKTDLYINVRALMYFRYRKWLFAGGVLIDTDPNNSNIKKETLAIKYRRSMQGNKIQIMSKKEMQKLRIPSPNDADAMALTFLKDIEELEREKRMSGTQSHSNAQKSDVDDRFDVL